MNSEVVAYSGGVEGFAVDWVMGSFGIRDYPVGIGEMDVSNGPESGHDLVAILDARTASLCQLRP